MFPKTWRTQRSSNQFWRAPCKAMGEIPVFCFGFRPYRRARSRKPGFGRPRPRPRPRPLNTVNVVNTTLNLFNCLKIPTPPPPLPPSGGRLDLLRKKYLILSYQCCHMLSYVVICCLKAGPGGRGRHPPTPGDLMPCRGSSYYPPLAPQLLLACGISPSSDAALNCFWLKCSAPSCGAPVFGWTSGHLWLKCSVAAHWLKCWF